MDVVKVRKAILQEIIEHTRQEAPLECCGLLTGEGDVINRIRKMSNVLQSPVRFSMDPQALFRFFKDLRSLPQKHLGIYHSHPVSEAYPSAIDIEQAFYPDCAYLIASLRDPPQTSVRAFRIWNRTVLERKIQVIE
jgi:[CysO sulfur-carrier protein]-S-L-cysteine hydrolase